ncbi:MAG: NAD-dependent epimerase/dehydratase family protein [Euryarchaeota archaeon]|nr:NAD-dependent epimerase/dehydratase family protein [Euryarchaeota archaeon]MBU4223210.1 NAD-dependent epimerase/dehydratase family protein [Euryarchaeota archaeon]MBU4340294.1 NAD-dependent epimerase/dehydratase family protein [Euryarchaeota archaeon]MBU4454390.1 NAD-dependent epimerase/dehydratase family protein [Euryarchaeota archaeon]MCG2734766.1 NAD-dependent epimerase/dehydratase family protein [Candidatus Methanoperedenaceae archaeon]
MKNKIIVTGGAGFIGSHLIDRMLLRGDEVVVIDNLSSGKMDFLKDHVENPDFKFIRLDLLDLEELKKYVLDADAVFHLAANPDVRLGVSDTRVHLEQNIIATYNLLEAMRINKIKNILFTSTSTVYGEAMLIPTPEEYGPLVPISLYGASKLACEALITSYCSTFDMNSWLFRFANIVGPRGTHGIIVDFMNKLRKNPGSLEILGDGKQRKSYLHVYDCIEAILFAMENSNEMVNIFNIGSVDTISATEIGRIVVEEMGLEDVEFKYTGGSRGWKGDVPKMMLSIDKIRSLGWKPVSNSEKSVRDAVRSLLNNG